MTGPANDAGEEIVLNDVFRVVPKARNNLNVAVVQGLNVALRCSNLLSSRRRPDRTHKGPRRTRTAATGQGKPAHGDRGTRLGAGCRRREPQRRLGCSFQASELVLLGFVQTPDAAAQELAQSGDVGAAVAAGAEKAPDVVNEAGGLVVDAVETAATNIRDSLDDPFPSSTKTPTTTRNAA